MATKVRTNDEKVIWLINHKELWEKIGSPDFHGDMQVALDNVLIKMKDDKIYSYKSEAGVNSRTMFRLFDAARKKMKEDKALERANR